MGKEYHCLCLGRLPWTSLFLCESSWHQGDVFRVQLIHSFEIPLTLFSKAIEPFVAQILFHVRSSFLHKGTYFYIPIALAQTTFCFLTPRLSGKHQVLKVKNLDLTAFSPLPSQDVFGTFGKTTHALLEMYGHTGPQLWNLDFPQFLDPCTRAGKKISPCKPGDKIKSPTKLLLKRRAQAEDGVTQNQVPRCFVYNPFPQKCSRT